MSTEYSSTATLFINGKRFNVDSEKVDPRWTLLQFLRKAGLTGTKLGCGEGGCGACTVMLSSFNKEKNQPVHYSANACLVPICALDGVAVTTVEGIGGMREGLHPVQQRIASAHGSQCGFCTPGIVMAVYTQLRANPQATPHELEESLDGNLCRCTGYRPILDAAKSLSNNKPAGCCGGNGSGSGCPCSAKDLNADGEEIVKVCTEGSIANWKSLKEEMTAKGLTEPIFPPALTHYVPQPLCVKNEAVTWYQPVNMTQLLELKAANPGARLVVGNTEVGIEVKFKAMEYSTLINPTHISELQVLETKENEGITIGAAVSINRLRTFALATDDEFCAKGKGYLTRGLKATAHMLTWFASNHIRNMACVGGNIVTASPISDLNPMLMACGATLTVTSAARGSRTIPMSKFFLSYRKVDLQPDEVLESVFLPFTSKFEFVLPFKQARRREDDISIVTSGMRMKLNPSKDWEIEECHVSFGGMAPTTVLAPKTSAALAGAAWNYRSIQSVFTTLREEMALPTTVPGGQAEFRMALTVSFLLKAYVTITNDLRVFVQQHSASLPTDLPAVPEDVDAVEQSAERNFITAEKAASRGESGYSIRKGGLTSAYPVELAPAPVGVGATQAAVAAAEAAEAAGEQKDRGVVGKPIMHKNAEAQVTGETKYTDDLPLNADALHAAVVQSTRAHAKVLSVDTSAAEKCPGFVAYYCAKDVIGSNKIGPIVQDEEIFSSGIVKHYGAVIGVIIANTHEQAVYATRKVKVEYEDLPAIISIADAIAAGSFFDDHHVLTSGNMNKEKAEADVHVEGTGRIGAQEHFYLETLCTVAIPQENGHMEVFSSTQAIAKTQKFCASVCGLPASKVVAKCKRLGGGFGGKETRTAFIACAATLAAFKLNRPVSINIERDVDMCITGQRHSFLFNYKAGCMKDGTLKYLDIDLFSNAGYSLDLSVPVMDRALFHVDNCYSWPAISARGNVCRTNQPSHTAYRGFGGPQGLAASEMVLEHLANELRVSPEKLRNMNLYKEGELTHYGQPLEDWMVPKLWAKAHIDADFIARRQKVDDFNKANRWRKRGLSLLPTKFGLNYTAKFMNQGGALVHIYTDGSVLVAHGGTEMGQGLYTKMIQVAAQCFGISDDMVTITETASNTIANSLPTAASLSTDMYGMAVLNACEQIQERLVKIKATLPADADWLSIVNAAYFNRVDLSAHGFYVVDPNRCGFDWSIDSPNMADKGTPFNYFTTGVACAEVEVDCLTGDSHVIRADVVMDLGKSVNPAIDIGQIEGAFVQGYGWSTMEELVRGDKDHPWVQTGQLFTRGPGTYKIPSFNDVPMDFRVHLSDTDNKYAVHSSKAVGEPPFFMGAAPYFAIRDAVRAARFDNLASGEQKNDAATEYYNMDLPATSERIRMACADDIAQMCIGDKTTVNKFHPLGSF